MGGSLSVTTGDIYMVKMENDVISSKSFIKDLQMTFMADRN